MLKKDSPNLASVLDAMEDGIYVINDRYLIEFMNMRMVQDFGNGTGKKCYNILQHRDSVCPWCRAQEVFKGSTVRWELHIAEIDKAYDLIELP